MWAVGQKIVCGDERFPGAVAEWGDKIPREGRVYTIRAIATVPHAITGKPGLALLLEELHNPRCVHGGELHFSDWRFMPVEHNAVAMAASVMEPLHETLRTRAMDGGDFPL